MKPGVFQYRTELHASLKDVFDWHKRPGAFEALCPPWMDVSVVERSGDISDGGKVVLEIGAGPIKVRWNLEHRNYIEGRQFQDVQVSGPFSRWEHTHRFASGAQGCVLEDTIEFGMPLLAGPILPVLPVNQMVVDELNRMFAYRQDVLSNQFRTDSAHSKDSDSKDSKDSKASKASKDSKDSKDKEVMKIAISGSHGLIGSALVPLLKTQGHEVHPLVRDGATAGDGDIRWSGESTDVSALNGMDAVVHLAGENIASRWNPEKKQLIRDSRIKATKALSEGIARLSNPPKVLVCASAIGFYGDRGDQELDENSPAGTGFLSQVCRDWEAATMAATDAGVRVVNLRTGVVLSPKGGALAQMLPPFLVGAGGPIGNGKQYMSWISVDDEAGAICHCLSDDRVRGPVNLVAPEPVTNNDFTKALGAVLHRPTFFPVPDFAARLVFGEMADELLLASTKVKPAKLLNTNYRFMYPNLEAALHHVLGK